MPWEETYQRRRRRRKPRPGRSLEEVDPRVAREFDAAADLNGVRAGEVCAGSKEIFFFQCSCCQFHYMARPGDRTRPKGALGCPSCKRSKINTPRPGYPPRDAPFAERRLSVVRPDLAAQWCAELNETRPEDHSYGSGRSAWWKCALNHRWQARICDRTSSKEPSCPYCSSHGGRGVASLENSLQAARPELAAEWHPTRNGDARAGNVRANSTMLAWWLCSACSHEWADTPNRRASYGGSCPACRARRRGGGGGGQSGAAPDREPEQADPPGPHSGAGPLQVKRVA
eukprot:tig00020960_g16592.t1